MAVDPKIKQKADDIRNKIYGKEVRESLASGLEAISSDVVKNEGRQSVVESRQDSVESQWQVVSDEMTDKDVISAPEIIAARDGEANLKARLDKDHQEVTAQLADIVKNVKLLGVKGDGVTDDTDAIQNAFNNHKSLFFPIGIYKITRPLVLSSGHKLCGRTTQWQTPNQSAVIRKVGNNLPDTPFTRTARSGTRTDDFNKDAIFLIDHPDDSYAMGVEIKDMYLEGQDTSYADYGIYAPRTGLLKLNNVQIYNTNNVFFTHDTWLASFERLIGRFGINGVVFKDDGSKLLTGTTLDMHNSFMSYMSGNGYDIYGLYYSSFSNCGADYVSGKSYRIEKSDITLNGCGAEHAKEVIDIWASRVIVNGFRSLAVTGSSTGETAYLRSRAGGKLILNACDLSAMTTPGTTYDIICDTGGKIIFNETTPPTGGNTFVSFSDGAYIIENNDGFPLKKTANGFDKQIPSAMAVNSNAIMKIVGDKVTNTITNPQPLFEVDPEVNYRAMGIEMTLFLRDGEGDSGAVTQKVLFSFNRDTAGTLRDNFLILGTSTAALYGTFTTAPTYQIVRDTTNGKWTVNLVHAHGTTNVSIAFELTYSNMGYETQGKVKSLI